MIRIKLNRGPVAPRPQNFGIDPWKFSNNTLYLSWLLKYWIVHVQSQLLGHKNIHWVTKIVMLWSPARNSTAAKMLSFVSVSGIIIQEQYNWQKYEIWNFEGKANHSWFIQLETETSLNIYVSGYFLITCITKWPTFFSRKSTYREHVTFGIKIFISYHRGHNLMVVGFTTTFAISASHH